MDFFELRKQILERRFFRMNGEQQKAIFQVDGPVLILAGAGSGKTTVIVNRIANMVCYGHSYHSRQLPNDLTDADLRLMEEELAGNCSDPERLGELLIDRPVKPWGILAITFTNKAAGELKGRLEQLLGEEAREIQASTFHSACVRMLRRFIDRLEGYSTSFTIYDTTDSIRVIKDCLKAMNLDEKMFPPRQILSVISKAKDKMTSPEQLLAQAEGEFRISTFAKVYARYQEALKSANALDFDDIICLTVRLLQSCPDVLEYYQNRWRYIMVDEYQDTNHCQFLLVSLLADKYKNLCVVGDDDQSIYKFRGATIENILNFEQQFDNAMVIRLEQNYRCTKNILNAANEVIDHNIERKGKTLWTENDQGTPVHIYRCFDEIGEANYIAGQVLEAVQAGGKFADHAVLYRMNAQSNAIEKCFLKHSIPYKIVGGLKFYERKEIKDIVAYLNVLNNPADNLRMRRIINEPKRGIGEATIAAAQTIADQLGLPLFEIIRTAGDYPVLVKKAKTLADFANLIENLIEKSEQLSLEELFDQVLDKTGYLKFQELQGSEGQNRIENIQELKSNIVRYEEASDEPSLAGFLEEIALYTDLDQLDEQGDYTVLMTLHSAKGLEFPNVYIAGMEDGIFPGHQSLQFPSELEEERRLAYVGITRAKRNLYLTSASQRLLLGQTMRNRISQFIGEIPKELREVEDHTILTGKAAAAETPAMKRRQMIQIGRSLGIAGGIAQPGKAAASSSDGTAPQSFQKDDRVRHKVFGEGVVLKATPMANDTLLEIQFERSGLKKIMANFAKVSKV